jgi:hypothetical protein
MSPTRYQSADGTTRVEVIVIEVAPRDTGVRNAPPPRNGAQLSIWRHGFHVAYCSLAELADHVDPATLEPVK